MVLVRASQLSPSYNPLVSARGSERGGVHIRISLEAVP
jgi:hypothetical protein